MGTADTRGTLTLAFDGGDRELGDLLERIRPRLVMWAAARLSPALRTKVEPEDVVQDVLVAVHRGFREFEGREPGAFFQWVFTIGEHRIRDLVDHFGALKRRLPEPRSFSQTSASTAASRSEQVGRMMEALQRLSEEHRQAIVLLKIEERPAAEAALVLGRSENACRILLCRAMKALSAELDDASESRCGEGS
jgi:RNA polymerase sigma-70 factor, ECF subfamily